MVPGRFASLHAVVVDEGCCLLAKEAVDAHVRQQGMKGLVDETCYGFGGGRFTAGFQDATRRNKKYKPETLKRVTWQSLGYRLGQEFGIMPDAWIHELKIILERYLAGIMFASPWNPSNKG